jgi:energy-converting hydrogenase Eha subunit A
MKKEHVIISSGLAILLSLLVAIALGLTAKTEIAPAEDVKLPIEEPKPVISIGNISIYRICIDDRLFILTKANYTSTDAMLLQVFSAYGAAADCWEKKEK